MSITSTKVAVQTEAKPLLKPTLHVNRGSFVTFDLQDLPAAKRLLHAALDTLQDNEYATYLSGDAKSSMNLRKDPQDPAHTDLMCADMEKALEREAQGLHPIDWEKVIPGGR